MVIITAEVPIGVAEFEAILGRPSWEEMIVQINHVACLEMREIVMAPDVVPNFAR